MAINRDKQSILWFKEISNADVPLVGGKNASLGEMYSKLSPQGIHVPNGFAITAEAYRNFLCHGKLEDKIKKIIKSIDVTNVKVLRRQGAALRALIMKAPLPGALVKEITTAYRQLSKENKQSTLSVAVRSSATAEDLPEASFAGQQETFLNIRGDKAVLLAVKKCFASLFTDRAISYREGRGFDHVSIALSVTIQQMVRSETAVSGVLFTMDTESGFRGVVLVTASYGLGEYVVKGRVVPDQFYVFKDGLKLGKKAIISRTLGTKDAELVYADSGGTKHKSVLRGERNRFCISDEEVLQLAKWGTLIEEHYGRPQDIEWAKDGDTGKLYIVQARPETVKAQTDGMTIESYQLKKDGSVLLRGIAVGQKIGAGRARVIEHTKHMKHFKKGEVLVTRITDPDWEPIMRLASAIVTEQGGKTSHAAIVSRELGVPCIVGAHGARRMIKTGQPITVSCAKGDEGVIYKGILPFEVQKTLLKDIPQTKTKVMMNVGDPDHAFQLSFLPHDGVGLARLEFIFSNFIRIHPLALIHYNRLKDTAAKKKIAQMTRGYRDKSQYCVDKLAEGVARIAVAMHPHPVIVRLSDFKTNEYATLIGGKEFEPKEENPMLGWRGASRYYSKEYKDGFRLECEAMKKVRNEWGLTNVIVMVPFCRTPEEGEKVLKTMAEFGLKRGENGLQVYVMCEIPSNVILAKEFAAIFDGVSIGSNDLTQLTLGVDRDSALVSHVYNENNPAIKQLIRDVIRVTHEQKKKVGICGQAPSDHPEFAEFLVKEGIDSISLNPDTVVSTRQRIAYAEKTIGKTGQKTNAKLLGLIAAFGILMSGFVGLGVGCVERDAQALKIQEQANQDTVSPAEIREQIEKKLAQSNEQKLQDQRSILKVSDFSTFELEYPSSWNVEFWSGGVTVSDKATGDMISIFRQILSHPIPESQKEDFVIDNINAKKYVVELSESKIPLTIIEIPTEDGVLEINAMGEKWTEILPPLFFQVINPNYVTKVTHWDVREKRFCVPMATFAQASGGAQCEVFLNPCEVPKSWDVCK